MRADHLERLMTAEAAGRVLMPDYRLPRSTPRDPRATATPTASPPSALRAAGSLEDPVGSGSEAAARPAVPGFDGQGFDGPGAAVAWFCVQLDGVVAAQQWAHAAGHHDRAIAACQAGYVAGVWLRRYESWLGSHELGIASATAVQDQPALAAIRTQLATALIAVGRTDSAATQLEQAQYAARASGRLPVEAAAQAGLGDLAHARGDYSGALACWRLAGELHECAGQIGPVIDMRRRAGVAWRDSGSPGGLAAADRSLADAIGELADMITGTAGPVRYRWLHARALADLAAVRTAQGRPGQALGLLDQARAGMDALAAPAELADIDLAAGDALARLGDHAAARDRYGQAKATYRAISATWDLPKPGERLARLPPPHPGMRAEEVASRANTVPALLAEQLRPEATPRVWQYLRAGAWSQALDVVIADLHATGTPITTAQHDQLAALMAGIGLPGNELDLLLHPRHPTGPPKADCPKRVPWRSRRAGHLLHRMDR